jgi:hypothetical protein
MTVLHFRAPRSAFMSSAFRDGHMAGGHNGDSDYARETWFHCSCCGPT